MKPRMLFVVLILIFAALACNMPADNAVATGTRTPTGSLDVLTQAAQTAQAGQTPLASATTPPAPTQTLPGQPTATITNTRAPATNTPQPCDQAGFIQDVSIPDGAKLTPGQVFTKTWRLRNTGTCTWNNSYAMVFASGDAMGAPAVVNLPGNVPSYATVDLSIQMKAPTAPGKYQSNWKLRNSTGAVFGILGDQPFFVQIEVVPATITATVTVTNAPPTTTFTPTATVPSGLISDFTASMCKAEWRSQAGVLGCPGATGDAKGYVVRLQSPQLETGTTENNPVLLTVPDTASNGAITGKFPPIAIQKGMRFQSTVGCLYGANKCSVVYQVNYIINNGQPVNLGQWTQTYDGSIQGIDLDLSSLDGQSVQLVLAVVVKDTSEQAQAVWVYPRVVKP